MRVPDRAELTDGARVVLAAVRRSLRSLDRDRRAALALAVTMLLVLLAPWYEVVASAPGAGATHRVLRQSLSGWQALSAPGILGALVAVAVIALLLSRTGAVVDGLGAAGRRAARSRVDGRAIACGGAIAAIAELIGVGLPPGFPAALAGASSATSTRFGLWLAVAVAIALTAIGTRIARAPRDPGPPAGGPRPPRERGRRRPARPRTRDAVRTRDRDASWDEGDAPQFDFVVDRAPR